MIFKLFNSSPTTKACINIRHKHVNIMHVIKNPKRNQSLDLEGEMGGIWRGDGGGDRGRWRGKWWDLEGEMGDLEGEIEGEMGGFGGGDGVIWRGRWGDCKYQH